MYKNTEEIRNLFIDFYRYKNHFYIESSSLIPDDDSLLFTNAGMNQFKNIFLGIKKPIYKEVVSIQRCLRVGGKHNDLKNIGYTYRHNTFFEMMGSFSFNSYFKKTAILYAWELLTNKKWFYLSKDNLIVTVHINDLETYNIWLNLIGIKKKNIFLIGTKNNDIDIKSDNFWQMSDIGPCGYSTEIYYNINNYNTNNFLIYKNSNAYLEILNLVFIEYYINNFNKIDILPYKSVDTGMGLERISTILQKVKSNFDIDILSLLKNNISNFLNINIDMKNNFIFNIISDHIRAIVFLLIDGILPSNEFRGYVLRKIIRRTLTYINLLKINNLILSDLIFFLKDYFYNYYNIKNIKNINFIYIKNVILKEEKIFFKNLFNNLKVLNFYLHKFNDIKRLDGDIIFLLYDTYGLSLDIINEVSNYNNFILDIKGFNNLLNLQKKKSKKYNLFKKNKIILNINNKISKTIFLGYNNYTCQSKILYIFKDNINYDSINDNINDLMIILDNTVLYPNCGGQIGDKGIIFNNNNKYIFLVYDTKIFGDYIIHIGKLKGSTLSINDKVKVQYDYNHRYLISCNHSACHILLYTLKKIISNKIYKCGSLIKKKYFTLDYFYKKKINNKLIIKINEFINKKIIWKKLFFIEKYIKKNNINKKFIFLDKNINIFRIVKFDGLDEEYCCGTHVKNSNDIGLFYIYKNYNISLNINRIKVYTNINALRFINNQMINLKNIANLLSVNIKKVYNKIFSFNKKNINIKKNNIKLNYLFIKNILKSFCEKDIILYLNFNFLIKCVLNIYILDYNMLFMILNKLYIRYNLCIIILILVLNNIKKIIIYLNNFLLPNFDFNLLDFSIFKNLKFEIIKNKKFICKIFNFNDVENYFDKNKFIDLIKFKLFSYNKKNIKKKDL